MCFTRNVGWVYLIPYMKGNERDKTRQEERLLQLSLTSLMERMLDPVYIVMCTKNVPAANKMKMNYKIKKDGVNLAVWWWFCVCLCA